MHNDEKQPKKPHDAFFRWLFADTNHLKFLLELAGKINVDVADFLAAVNLDTLVRIPDSYSEVYETGDADLAFRNEAFRRWPTIRRSPDDGDDIL